MTEADAQLDAVHALKQAIYGALPRAPQGAIEGVIHTVAAVRRPPGRWHVIKIQAGAPHSESDAFVLNFWRAHYDAILTTGQILRSEPTLSYAQKGPLALGLTRYRREVLGNSGPTRCAIMTRGPQLPLDHPVFQDAPEIELVVLTAPQNVTELRKTLKNRAEVVGLDALDARTALDFLKRTGARTIGVEAGPSVAGTLYGQSPVIEHLMLSICDTPVEPQIVGGGLPEDAAFFADLTCMSEVSRAEQSGPWRFQRWQRAESLRGPGGHGVR